MPSWRSIEVKRLGVSLLIIVTELSGKESYIGMQSCSIAAGKCDYESSMVLVVES